MHKLTRRFLLVGLSMSTFLLSVWPMPASAGPIRVQDQVNRYRARVGARPVVLDSRLSKYALRWSKHMAETGRLADPDTSWMIHAASGHDGWRGVADSVGGGTPHKPKEIVRAMWHCKLHRNIIKDSLWTHVGVGIYRDDDGGVWLTLLFLG